MRLGEGRQNCLHRMNTCEMRGYPYHVYMINEITSVVNLAEITGSRTVHMRAWGTDGRVGNVYSTQLVVLMYRAEKASAFLMSHREFETDFHPML